MMGSYVEIGELRTWYDEQGAGEPLVLLHGGISTNETWGAQMPDFGARFRVIAPERRGHGHTPDLEGPLSYDVMANDTIGLLEAVVGDPAHLVGWSDGGIVGLLVAMARPDLVRKLVVISANFDTSGIVPQAMEGLTSMTAGSDDPAVFRTPYEAASPDGPEHLAGGVRQVPKDGLNATEHHRRAAGSDQRTHPCARRRRRHDQPRAHVGALSRDPELRTRGRAGHVAYPPDGKARSGESPSSRFPRKGPSKDIHAAKTTVRR